MSAQNTDSEVVADLAEQFVERYRSGERPSIEEYVAEHADLEDVIRDVFPALLMIENLAPEHDCSIVGRVEFDEQELAAPEIEQLGDYRVLREVGHGGMGIVYEAEQVSLGRRVALKVLPPHRLLGAERRSRFQREARAAARLHHTNIVPVFGVGEHEGVLYYVMQFIQGLGLDEVLGELNRMRGGSDGSSETPAELRVFRRDVSAADVARSLMTGQFRRPVPEDSERTVPTPEKAAPVDLADQPTVDAPSAKLASAGRLSDAYGLSDSSISLPGPVTDRSARGAGSASYWQSVAEIGRQVAQALQYAHEQAVLHRDIKPSNLLLDTNGTAWITDFGLAKAGDQQDLTQTGEVLGTLRYMPPEAFEGKTDARSDVYSLGLTLYELLALRPAYDDADRQQLIQRVTSQEPPRLGRLNPAIPRDLATIVHKAVERDPHDRYQSASDLAEDLERFLDDEPIRARRVSLLERALRWSRRNKPLAASLLAVAALVLMIAVGSTIAAGYFRTLAEDAQQQRDNAERHLYVAHMQVAQRAMELEDTGRLEQLLTRWIPSADQPDLRSWEWYYLLQESHRRLIWTLYGHTEVVHAVDWSPDGRLASASSDGTIRIWNPSTGQLLKTLPGENATAAAWNPDSRQLVSGDATGRLRLWNVESGEQLRDWVAHNSGVTSVAWRPDGDRFASSSWDGTVKFWDAEGESKPPFTLDHEQGVWNIAWCPDGTRIAVAAESETPIWDAETGEKIYELPGRQCRAVAWSPNGRWLVCSMGYDPHHGQQVLTMYDAESREPIHELRGHTWDVISLAWSPDDTRLASASNDDTVRIWDTSKGETLRVLRGHTATAQSVSWDSNGKRLASAGDDYTIKIWDTDPDAAESNVLRGHEGVVRVVRWSPDGRRLASAGYDGTVRLWDPLQKQSPSVLGEHSDHHVDSLVWSPDGKRIASSSKDETVRVWDAETGEQLHKLTGHSDDVQEVDWSPDGRYLASASVDRTIRIWDAQTGTEVKTLPGYKDRNLFEVAWRPDSRRIASVTRTELKIWDVETERPVVSLQLSYESCPCLAWSFDGKRLASTHDNFVSIYDASTGEVLQTFRGHTAFVQEVVWSKDGNRLATCSSDHTIKIWDLTTGEELLTLHGHTLGVRSIDWSPDGRTLVSAGYDETIRIWDAARGYELANDPAYIEGRAVRLGSGRRRPGPGPPAQPK